jgi:hypothetical protein
MSDETKMPEAAIAKMADRESSDFLIVHADAVENQKQTTSSSTITPRKQAILDGNLKFVRISRLDFR